MNERIYYSKISGGFYNSDWHSNCLPTDAVEISNETHATLLEGERQGKIISGDENGYPVLTARPAPTQEQLENTERIWRDAELRRADIALNLVQDADPKCVGTVTVWRQYRKDLRALPEHELFPAIEARPVAPDAPQEDPIAPEGGE